MPARSHNRYPYSPIAARPVYDWPAANGWQSMLRSISNGSRLAKASAPNWRPAGRNRMCSITLGATMATASAYFASPTCLRN